MDGQDASHPRFRWLETSTPGYLAEKVQADYLGTLPGQLHGGDDHRHPSE